MQVLYSHVERGNCHVMLSAYTVLLMTGRSNEIDPNVTYCPGSAEALTLREGAEQIAYCYYCQVCPHRARVDLGLIADDYEPGTLVGDLIKRLKCAECGGTKKIVMTLWLRATTTEQMLRERGFPVW